MGRVKIGVVGCGKISGIYLKNLTQVFKNVEVAAVTDLQMERAREKADEYGIPKACTMEEMLGDPEIRIVLNLTVPKAHFSVAMAALEAGKSVYNEKPLGITREEGQKILELAAKKGLLVGCAPDTFLGSALQTCRSLVDEGLIGRPVAATAFFTARGPESWHPNPDFFYKEGGGPFLDMGPYYLTALISLVGPVKRVTGMAKASFDERTITNETRYGEKIKVEIPTHVTASLEFENGAVGTLISSFDIVGSRLPRIEIYGSEGTLSVPDPNMFSGTIFYKKNESADWIEMGLSHNFCMNSRGLGVADMAYALETGSKHRANGKMAFHVLDIIQSIHESSRDGMHKDIGSTCERPEPFRKGLSIQDFITG